MLQLIVILIIFSNANKIKHILGNSVSYPMWLEYMMEFTKHQTIKMRELCFSLLKI